jgi:hyperosmotically inducible periplasmic protein
VFLFAGMALLSACATAPERAEANARIVSSITDSGVYKTHLADQNINVLADNDVVTLTGTVTEEPYRMVAQEIAEDTPGVKSVDNRIQVQGGSTREGSDAWIGAKVKSELMMQKNVDADKAEVFVKDGVVTLRGEANSPVQRDLVTEYTRNTEGVRGVVNQMTVAGTASAPPTVGQAVDDASITAQVKLSLLSNRSTSTLDTQVNTSNGIVTVQGLASNQAEKELVTQLIKDINGVRGVNNQMFVQAPASLKK